MITLYHCHAARSFRPVWMLEEMGLPYQVHVVDITKGEQNAPEFLKLSPNNKIPAIVDPQGPTSAPVSVFESGAILIYLAEKTGRLMPADSKGRSLVLQWLMFQMGGVGPMMGQANVFFRYFPEKIEPAIKRYQNEGRRLFEVLDTRLGQGVWLADDYASADIANWCWVRTYKWSGISRDGLDNLDRWMNVMKAKPGLQRGIEVPFSIESIVDDEEKAEEFARKARNSLQT